MIWGKAGFIFQDKMFAFPIQSRAFQISSSGEFDPRGSNLAQKCTYQLKSEMEFKKLFVSMTCLPTAHRLGHRDLLRCMAWDLSSVSKGPTCAIRGSCEARQMGVFGCVEHLAEEHLASHGALFWNGSHRTQPCSVRAPGCSQAWSKLFLKYGDAAVEFRRPCSLSVWGGGYGNGGIHLCESNLLTAHGSSFWPWAGLCLL